MPCMLWHACLACIKSNKKGKSDARKRGRNGKENKQIQVSVLTSNYFIEIMLGDGHLQNSLEIKVVHLDIALYTLMYLLCNTFWFKAVPVVAFFCTV